jgi:Leucine-rich repeat (LRR) protein
LISPSYTQALPLTLLHLDISRNAIRTLAGLGALTALQWLDARCNQIQVCMTIKLILIY